MWLKLQVTNYKGGGGGGADEIGGDPVYVPGVLAGGSTSFQDQYNRGGKGGNGKINTITGKGVPGGFTGTNKLIPKVAAAGVASNIAAIAAKVSSIKASIPGAAAAQAKLAGLKAKALSKIN